MKRRIGTILVVLIALGISTSQPVSATIITVEVSGVVDLIATDGGLALDGSVGLGSVMSGTTTYDTEAPSLEGGGYAMISILMTIGNYTFTHDPMSPDPPLFSIYTVDSGYIASSDALLFDGTIYVNGSPKTFDDITWGWTYLELFNLFTSSSELIPTDALPDLDSWPDFSVFDWRREFKASFYDESNRNFQIRGEITSLNVVPEPATVLLLALGGLALLRKRRA